ncbi:MAG TPA: serine/threonine-protein phosphatase, partial [Bacillota bacterium]|nr:serine/threonine-protein phosphatase [Bacillota bacterium]
HIVCGGTTSKLAAAYLHSELRPKLQFDDPDIPPTAELRGCDLVTEGVITINRVLEYAKDYLADNKSFERWCYKKDGASLIARMLFEDATDISFYVGKAVNPAHQNIDLPINFTIKMQLVKELSSCLEKMGKRINVSYF